MAHSHSLADLFDAAGAQRWEGRGGADWFEPETISTRGSTFLGAPTARLRGDRTAWTRLVHPGAWTTIRRYWTRVRAGEPACVTVRATTAGGESAWVRLAGVRLGPPDAEGVVTAVHLVEDLTADVEAAAAPKAPPHRRPVEHAEIVTWRGEGTAEAFRLTHVSREAEALLGYPAEAWTAEPAFLRAHVHPEDLPQLRRRLAGLRPGQWQVVEYRLRAADGRWVRVRDSTTGLAQDGSVVAVGVLVEVTEEGRAERALRARDEDVRDFLRAARAVLWRGGIWAGRFRVDYVSQSVEAMLGWPPEHWTAHPAPVREALHPDDRGPFLGFLATAGPGDRKTIEGRLQHASGEWLWGRHSLRVLGTRTDGALDLAIVTVDTSAEHAGEAAHREAIQALGWIVEHAQVSVWRGFVRGDEVTVTFVGPGNHRLLGYPGSRWLEGRAFWSTVLHPEDAPLVRARSARLGSEDGTHTAEYRVRAADGRWVFLRDIATVTGTAADGRRDVVGVVVDVTEQREAQQALAEREAELRGRTADLHALLDASEQLARRLEPEGLAYHVAVLTCDLAAATGATVWGYDEVDGAFVCLAAAPRGGAVRGAPASREGSLQGHALDAGGPVFRTAVGPGGAHELAVPMLLDGHPRGALLARRAGGEPFTAREGRLLQALALKAAVAQENARLVRDLELLSRRLLVVQENERRYLAAEIHDECGALMTSVNLTLRALARHAHRVNDVAFEEALNEVGTLVSDLMGRLRRVALDLRPSVLDDLGLVPALRVLFDQHRERTGVIVHFHHEVPDRARYDTALETAAYRIVQEALTNVARHAGVEEAQVILRVDPDPDPRHPSLVLHVLDEGRGFEGRGRAGQSSGVLGMRERARLAGGALDIESMPGLGTRVSARLPLVPAPDGPAASVPDPHTTPAPASP